jgi:SAM-dependent methyltransferase
MTPMGRINMSTEAYDDAFYKAVAEEAHRSAGVIVPMVLDRMRVDSVVDVGCGWGVWLAAFRNCGVKTVLGLDQSAVDASRLAIPRRNYRVVDLRHPLRVRRRFDLVVSLEVAEHLPPECAESFVRGLCGLGQAILFSAAIPHQGGTRHLNEQWPEYWAALFGRFGFLPVDFLRRRIWQHPQVSWWYSQNAMLYATASFLEAHPKLKREQKLTGRVPAALVHPKRYLEWVEWGINLSDQR